MTGSRLRPAELIQAAAIALLLAAVAGLGLPESLGAHPWWAAKAGIAGTGLGALGYLALRLAGSGQKRIIAAAATGLIVAAASAHFGKQVFAASYAGNHVAGRFWYFGWYGVSGFFCLLVLSTLVKAPSRI